VALAAARAADALQRARPSTSELAGLQVAADGDAVILKALSMLPKEVHSTRGVASTNALQVRFMTASKAARTAALTPEGTGMLGQALGAATSRLVVTPPAPPSAPDAPRPAPSSSLTLPEPVVGAWRSVVDTVRGWLPGGGADEALPAPVVEGARRGMDVVKEIAAVAAEKTSDVTRVHALFDRADAAVAAGDFTTALAVLAPLRGTAADALSDWSAAARLRIATDAATSVISARATVLTAALY